MTFFFSWSSLTPSAAVTLTLVYTSLSPTRACWAVRVSRKKIAAPGLVTVKSAMPEIFAVWVPTAPMTRISSPSFRPWLSAVSASTMIWPAPSGSVPEVISMVRASLSFQLPTMVGAPLFGERLSLSPSTTVTWVEATVPSADRTPSAASTFSSTDAGSTGGLPLPAFVSPVSEASLWLTVTSEAVAANSLSNVVFMVSVNTRVPHTNATDSRTAIADSAMRPLCAKKLRIEVLSTVMTCAPGRRSPSCGPGPARRWAGASRRRCGRRRGRARGPRRRRPRGRG